MNGVPFDTVHAALRDRGWDPTETTKGLRARCPAHGGTRDSLVVSRLDDGGAEMYCHSKKCSDHAVMRALELDPATRKRRRLPPDSKASCTWSYFDAAGNEVGRVLRWDFEGGAKEVRPRRPDGRGGWVKKAPSSWPLYNLPKLQAQPDKDVLIVEGEKTADAAARHLPNAVVVTSAMGADGAGKTDWAPLKDRDCIVWPDADEAGRDYARDVALHVPHVRCVDTTGLPAKWDLADAMPDGWDQVALNARLRDAKRIEPSRAKISHAWTARGLASALDAVGVELRWNIRGQRYEYRKDGQWQRSSDRFNSWLRQTIQERCIGKKGSNWQPLMYGKETFHDLRDALGFNREADPFIEKLEALPTWDRVARIDTLLCTMFGAEDTPIVRWASRYAGMAGVQRAMEPGCKLDEVPVLLGPQDCGKSSFIRCWLEEDENEWFGDAVNLAGSEKEQAEQLQGCVLVELNELVGMRKAEVEGLKSFVSRCDDGQHRLAYRRDPEPSKRRVALLGTTNELEPLPNDPSGNRRFVVIELQRGCNVEAASDGQRDQWWAESVARYQAGERANLPRALKEEAKEIAERHRGKDAMEEVVREAVADLDKVKGFSMGQLHNAVAGEGSKPADMWTQRRYGAALQNLGYRKRRVQRDGRQAMLWTAGPADVPTRDPEF